MKINFIFLLLLVIKNSLAANILCLMHIASPSHSIWNNVLIKGLADQGHNLTVIISDLPRNPSDISKNVTYFHVEEVYADIHDGIDIKELFHISTYVMAMEFCSYCTINCESTMNSKAFEKFMMTYDRNTKFDLILYDYTCGPCLIGLLEYFNYPPLIGISAFPYPAFAFSFSGGEYHPSYVNYHSAVLSPTDNFIDRFHNNFLYIFEYFYRHYKFYPDLEAISRKKYLSKNIKSYEELEKKVTITLVNSHPSITTAEPLPPSIIEVGGLQLVDAEPLPNDLEAFINTSKKGVIFFSMGTNVRPQDLSSDYIEIFLDVMKKYKDYNFMWKFDSAYIKRELPKNIMIRKFFPQRDILAHPKTKAFITHSGGLSTQESVWYGVPMLGIALFADQLRNIKDVVQKEIGVHVHYTTLTEKSFEAGLKEILENPKYMENIKLLSKNFRDRPEKPLKTAIWWIEYILRNQNPEHLKPKSLKMNYFIANSLDFYIVLGGFLQICFVAFVFIVYMCCCRRTNKKKLQEKVKMK